MATVKAKKGVSLKWGVKEYEIFGAEIIPEPPVPASPEAYALSRGRTTTTVTFAQLVRKMRSAYGRPLGAG